MVYPTKKKTMGNGWWHRVDHWPHGETSGQLQLRGRDADSTTLGRSEVLRHVHGMYSPKLQGCSHLMSFHIHIMSYWCFLFSYDHGSLSRPLQAIKPSTIPQPSSARASKAAAKVKNDKEAHAAWKKLVRNQVTETDQKYHWYYLIKRWQTLVISSGK